MPYLRRLQEELNGYFPTHLIDICREMTESGQFDRVWIDGESTNFGVYPDMMNWVLKVSGVSTTRIATDIAFCLKKEIELNRSL